MKNVITLGILIAGFAIGALILTIEPKTFVDEHGNGGESDEEFERGPNNGRLLRSGSIALELTIFEDGVPPEYRVYAYDGDAPLSTSGVDLTIELGRLGGATDYFTFVPEAEYLRGSGTVVEPHSFDVAVKATINGKNYAWEFASYEGRVQIGDAIAAQSGIETDIAGPAQIREVVAATGRIVTDPTRSARIKARFPGVIRELRRTYGETVSKGDTIAVVESNDSLQSYAIRSPVDGMIIAQNANTGETVSDQPIVEIADLSRVIAELYVFPRDIGKVSAGQPVKISAVGEDVEAESQLAMILPMTGAGSQAVPARIILDNPDRKWRIGMAVDGQITVGVKNVPLAVRTSGLQAFRDFTVVFARFGETYEVRMLDLGADDGEYIEVLGGLDHGTTYVSENSFLIKADIEKSGASHDH